ncbi:MAG: NAD+ synthase [Alphaproteobacteria bacterium]|nr:NAD+ synthase [Alphaproteobacteria bacterium]
MNNDTPSELKIALAQLNPVLGDISGNLALAREARKRAAEQGADLLLLTELFICGYPPEDLVKKPTFIQACKRAVEEFSQDTKDGGPGVVIGTPWQENDELYNAIALLDDGEIKGLRYKVDLPNYGTFDEKRLFSTGPMPGPISFRGVRLGIPICEDAWNDEVCECLMETGAEMLLVPNGSPYWENKADLRQQVLVQRIVETDLPVIYSNQMGGQDELVFDGGSFVLAADRTLALQMPQFEEGITTVIMDAAEDETGQRIWIPQRGELAVLPDLQEAHWQACVLGLKDYANKNGFKSVVLGLSGGVDSAACAAIAVDALGADRVHCLMLPYRFTSEESLVDAKACADAMGVRYDIVSIFESVEGFHSALGALFEGTEPGVAEENIQSRVRGALLMAVSNKFGPMLVTTGNKSEVSVGYATLYGDMNGGFNPIKDLYKIQVYDLCAWRNGHQPKNVLGPKGEVIPVNILTKAPTAELRDNQTDQDSLPPYEVLDDILECLVEEEMSIAEIVERGHDRKTVERIEHLLYIAEYKRRQAAPGVKLTRKNFGRDRRYPITNRFRDRS